MNAEKIQVDLTKHYQVDPSSDWEKVSVPTGSTGILHEDLQTLTHLVEQGGKLRRVKLKKVKVDGEETPNFVPQEDLIPAKSPSGYDVPLVIDLNYQSGFPSKYLGRIKGIHPNITARFGGAEGGFIHMPQVADGFPNNEPLLIQ